MDARPTPLLPYTFAKRHGVVVLPGDDEGLLRVVYVSLPALLVLSEIRRTVATPLRYEQVDAKRFEQLLVDTYQRTASQTLQMVETIGDSVDLSQLVDAIPETADLMEQEGDAPVIRLINGLIMEAIRQKASDIHIEAFEKRLVIRYRVDGLLRKVVEPRRELASLLTSRIKVMAKLDIAEKRAPQDGRMTVRVLGQELDLRVSTLPSFHGERIVLRLLQKEAGTLTLDALGLSETMQAVLTQQLSNPNGIILVTGPTGSGKTTTLYAGLTDLNEASRNILTAEDPVEYQLEGIGQTQINPKAGLTFAHALRAMLRQDPDVVMVGEIRDTDTLRIAVQASLTGHLVLSTLHTNTAIGAITRLIDMGVEAYLIASTLNAVMAQRLVRRLCPHCKMAASPNPQECRALGLVYDENAVIYHANPEGCEACFGQGYQGRIGIYELIVIDDRLRQMIHDRAAEMDLQTHARSCNASINDDAAEKIIAGLTTLEEVTRVVAM